MVLQSLQVGLTIAFFYRHQSVIAREQCINRFSTITNCNGHCFLKNQLTQAESGNHQTVPAVLLVTSDYQHHFVQLLPEPQVVLLAADLKKTDSYNLPKVQAASIFHPPKLA